MSEPPVLRVENLRKRYTDEYAVDDVSFTIGNGELVGYLGPNGSGKTTTVKIVTGILEPTAAETIEVNGVDVRRYPEKTKADIGYLPEDGGMYESLTAREYVQFVGRLYEMDDDLIEHRIERYFDYLDILDSQYLSLSAFSQGMKQKVLLTTALIHDPDLLLLDEPLSSLDVDSQDKIRRLLTELADRGKAILYCSHVLDVVERLCKRVLILSDGKLVADEDTERLKELQDTETLEDVFANLTRMDLQKTDASTFLDSMYEQE